MCAPRARASRVEVSNGARTSAALGHNLNDAANGIRSKERALRASHDLNPFDIVNRQMSEVVATAERVQAHAVDKDERVV